MYIYYSDGGVGPASLVEEHSNARKTHGDRVIADALSLWGASGMSGMRTKKMVAPARSFAARKKKWMRERKQRTGNLRIGQRIDLRGYHA